MRTVQLHPFSLLAGAALPLLAFVATGQNASREPGVLEVRELRVVDADGTLRVRIGPSESAGVGMWMLDEAGIERIAAEVTAEEEEGRETRVAESFVLRDREGNESVVLRHGDGRTHGDSQYLRVGGADRGFAVQNAGYGPSLSLKSDGGEIRMEHDYGGPLFRMKASATDLLDPPRPSSAIYIGRQNHVGFPRGALVAMFAHGEGRVEWFIDKDGEPTFRMMDAQGKIVAPEQD
jgi:hypothetical protein